MEHETSRPIYALLSLGLVAVPVGLFVNLLSGGGSGGFRAWNDLAMLLGAMFGSALLGLIFSGVSTKRQERSILNILAIVIHCSTLLFLVFALSQ